VTGIDDMYKFRKMIWLQCFLLAISFVTASSQSKDPITIKPVPTPQNSITSDDWKTYKLANRFDDVLSVKLPTEPKKFDGATFRGTDDNVLHADIFIASLDDERYIVGLIYDFPSKPGEKPTFRTADAFSGCSKGVMAFVQKALEEKFGRRLEFKSSGIAEMTIASHTWLYEDYELGQYVGHARMTFEGNRAFLLIGLYPPERKEMRKASYFDSALISVKDPQITH